MQAIGIMELLYLMFFLGLVALVTCLVAVILILR
jgi:hypothetical protein